MSVTDVNERLARIRTLLHHVDELICDLDRPDRPEGAYYEAWGHLGLIHSDIGRAVDLIDRVAAAQRTESSS